MGVRVRVRVERLLTVAEKSADKVPGQFSFDVDVGHPVGVLFSELGLPACGSLAGGEGVDILRRAKRRALRDAA